MKLTNSIFSVKKEHTLFTSFILHLLPGVLILIFYLLIYKTCINTGFYSQTALTISFLLIGVTIPILYLRFLSKKNKLKFFSEIVLYNNKLSWWECIVFPVLVIAVAIIISSFIKPVSLQISHSLSNILPQWFLRPDHIPVTISETNIVFTLIMVLVVDGILHPIVEEIYFRGYLMPRLVKYKKLAPIIAALFFALFHLWQPQNMITIFLMSIPWFYIVWWKKSFILSIIIHCLANSIGAISNLADYLY